MSGFLYWMLLSHHDDVLEKIEKRSDTPRCAELAKCTGTILEKYVNVLKMQCQFNQKWDEIVFLA